MNLSELSLLSIVLTLGAFRLGQLIQSKWRSPILNPILIAAVLLMTLPAVFGMDTGEYTASMKCISWLMTPATISLAIPMYEQFQILRKNLKAIVAAVAAGAVSSLIYLLLGSLVFRLDPALCASLLPKSVTTAIGVPLCELYGGLGGITTAAIIVTGIQANMMGPWLCRVLRITDPIAQGAALGTSGHVVGTARASEMGALTGAVSSLSLVTAGLVTALAMPLAAALL